VASTLDPRTTTPAIRVGIDAMGGDFAPEMEVGAALLAAQRSDVEIILYGKEDRIRSFLASGVAPSNVSIVHAEDAIGMSDEASTIVKTRQKSSLYLALNDLREGRIDAFVSAGNTGAVMSTATLLCGRIKGVSRPTIGTFLPTAKGGMTLLVDAGANVDSKAQFMRDFGIMGSVYTRLMRGIPSPTVGLLNVGEERSKGRATVKEAHDLLEVAPINFHGNVEGRDILKGTVDVVVCDGFEGNIVLKFAESILGFLKARFMAYAEKGLAQKLIMGALRPVFRKVLSGMDYQEYGGVPLLGVNGVVIIGHGSSSVQALHNMINRATEMVQLKVNDQIQETIARTTSNEEKTA